MILVRICHYVYDARCGLGFFHHAMLRDVALPLAADVLLAPGDGELRARGGEVHCSPGDSTPTVLLPWPSRLDMCMI